MKKTLTVLTLLAGATGLLAQGTWELSSYSGAASVLIYAPSLTTPTVATNGAGPNDRKAGTTVYTGAPLGGGSTGSGATAYGNGNNWTVAIYAAPGENNLSGLATLEAGGVADAIVTTHFLTSGGTGVVNAGTGAAGNDSSGMYAYNYGVATTTTFPSAGPAGPFGGGATLQLLAWYSGGGATYANSSVYGASAIGEIAALGGTGSPQATAGNLNGIGIESFDLVTAVTIPEPSTIALGVIGASTLLFRRRK
jgi:hypothetical protein